MITSIYYYNIKVHVIGQDELNEYSQNVFEFN